MLFAKTNNSLCGELALKAWNAVEIKVVVRSFFKKMWRQ